MDCSTEVKMQVPDMSRKAKGPSADSIVAATLMPFFIIMCELFTGILRPQSQMPAVWKYTMYYVTPFTYWIGGVLTSVLRGIPVT